MICREITKYHEEYIRSSVNELSNVSFSTKGEITVVISENKSLNLNINQLEESDKKKIKRFFNSYFVNGNIHDRCFLFNRFIGILFIF